MEAARVLAKNLGCDLAQGRSPAGRPRLSISCRDGKITEFSHRLFATSRLMEPAALIPRRSPPDLLPVCH